VGQAPTSTPEGDAHGGDAQSGGDPTARAAIAAGAWHRIRLPAPWHVSILSPSGSVEFARRFQRPSGLTEQSQVALEVQLRDIEFSEREESSTASSDPSAVPKNTVPKNASIEPASPAGGIDLVAKLNGIELEFDQRAPLHYRASVLAEQLEPGNQLAIRLIWSAEGRDANLLVNALESVALLLHG
jgi:hypothetical protein